jgi:FAD/FMN-containing dehydrogenase
VGDLIEQLRAIVGPEGIVTDPDELADRGADRGRGNWSIAPRVVVRPRSVAEVQAVVVACGGAGAAIVPSGGRTGLCGGAAATAGEVVLSLDRMHRILEIDRTAGLLRCEAGATVEAVQRAASDVGLMYPVDFAAKGTAQIGGSIATNAGGIRVLRYGSTRAWVSALDVIVASGERLSLGGDLVKDNTGYDLRQLFIGAEGTLGVIVGATLRLVAPPADGVVALCGVPDDASVLALFERARRGLVLQAFEYFEHACLERVLEHRSQVGGPFAAPSHAYVVLEAEVADAGDLAGVRARVTQLLEAAAGAGEIEDGTIASTAAQARDLWSLREDISESLHRHRPHKGDVSLPLGRIPEFLADWRALVAAAMPGARALSFGHIGDGNLHLNVLPAAHAAHDLSAYDERAYALVAAHHGSISAEHGIGLLKRDQMHHRWGEAELATMRAIKRALDPGGLFNPGKVLPDPRVAPARG